MQITPLQCHGSSLGSASHGGSACPQPIPAPGSLGSHTAAPRPRRTRLGSSDCSPFFRRKKKLQLTSLEAGLGPEPKNAPGSRVLTHGSQLGWPAGAAAQQECTELLREDLGAPARARPSQGSLRAAVNTSHVGYKRCPDPPRAVPGGMQMPSAASRAGSAGGPEPTATQVRTCYL